MCESECVDRTMIYFIKVSFLYPFCVVTKGVRRRLERNLIKINFALSIYLQINPFSAFVM